MVANSLGSKQTRLNCHITALHAPNTVPHPPTPTGTRLPCYCKGPNSPSIAQHLLLSQNKKAKSYLHSQISEPVTQTTSSTTPITVAPIPKSSHVAPPIPLPPWPTNMAPIKRKRGAAPRAPRQTRSATAANATSTTGTTAGAQNATTTAKPAEPAKPPVKKAKKRKEQKVTTYASSSASAPSPIKPTREKKEGRARKARKMPTATARRAVSLTPSLSSSTSKPSAAAVPTLERNVDNVVLGDILFRAWYPSRHVKEIVGREVVEEKEMLERLYVCKHCFKYSKELMGWVGHGKACERRRGGAAPMVPGRKVYSHGDSGWSVWEVDGEVDSVGAPVTAILGRIELTLSHSYIAKTCACLRSCSSITSPSSSMSPALYTYSSSTRTLRQARSRSLAFSARRRCRGITITSPVSSSSRRGNIKVSAPS